MTNPSEISEQFRQQAAQAGISGDAVIECQPKDGFMRVKVTWNPPARQEELTKSLAETTTSLLQMMGVQVKVRIE